MYRNVFIVMEDFISFYDQCPFNACFKVVVNTTYSMSGYRVLYL